MIRLILFSVSHIDAGEEIRRFFYAFNPFDTSRLLGWLLCNAVFTIEDACIFCDLSNSSHSSAVSLPRPR